MHTKRYPKQLFIFLFLMTLDLWGVTAFYKDAKGIIHCDTPLVAGDSQIIDGVTYTKISSKYDLVELDPDNSFGGLSIPAKYACTTGITDMSAWFSGQTNTFPYNYSTFNEDISHWDTSSVQSMSKMFYINRSFNQAIGNWDTSNVKNMSFMFSLNKAFNMPINDWNTSRATDMQSMFQQNDAFNQPIGNWNTHNVLSMRYMFAYSIFNQDISRWETGNVTDMSFMFNGSDTFNQPIGQWDTSNVTNMDYMFYNAAEFYQDLRKWCVEKVTTHSKFDKGAGFENVNVLQPRWGQCLPLDITSSTLIYLLQ